jgi:hypothetical protein
MTPRHQTIAVFRKDPTNVGDWWSPPHRYFALKPEQTLDLVHLPDLLPQHGLVLVGGGGLGREGFRGHLQHLRRACPDAQLVAWGVGADLPDFDIEREHRPSAADLLGDYFQEFDHVKSRVWMPDQPDQWVPCSSAMHPEFDNLWGQAPDVDVVVYSHKRKRMQPPSWRNLWKKSRSPLSLPRSVSVIHADNEGQDIVGKLKTLARARVVVTNSYHGVYWSTLLGKKVVCVPFKSGLFSFRHRPLYRLRTISLDDLHLAPAHPEALRECRSANLQFFEDLCRRYEPPRATA